MIFFGMAQNGSPGWTPNWLDARGCPHPSGRSQSLGVCSRMWRLVRQRSLPSPACCLGSLPWFGFALVSVKTIPQAWLQVRQVHLRKDDGGTVGSLRPIAVESIFLRLVSSSYVRTPQVQEWIASRVPEQCHGGLKSRGVATAWRQLNEAFETRKFLLL